MPSSHERLNELAVLMDLRLAFGPGTHLWSLRSREEICYDWLHFKARQLEREFPGFRPRALPSRRRHNRPSCARACYEIRRRVAIVLKAYRIKKRARASPAAPAPPSARSTGHRGPEFALPPRAARRRPRLLAGPAVLIRD